MLLAGDNDRRNAICTIHPGAGGTESQDWAEMLLRMYLKWAEQREFKTEILEYQPGEEAGLSVTFRVEGEYAYGLLAVKPVCTGWSRSLPLLSSDDIFRFSVCLPRGRRRRSPDQRQRRQEGYVLLFRAGRPVGQHNVLGHPLDAHSNGHRRFVPGRKIPDQEPRQSDARSTLASVRIGT